MKSATPLPVQARLCDPPRGVVVGADFELEVSPVTGRQVNLNIDGLTGTERAGDDAIGVFPSRHVGTVTTNGATLKCIVK